MLGAGGRGTRTATSGSAAFVTAGPQLLTVPAAPEPSEDVAVARFSYLRVSIWRQPSPFQRPITICDIWLDTRLPNGRGADRRSKARSMLNA